MIISEMLQTIPEIWKACCLQKSTFEMNTEHTRKTCMNTRAVESDSRSRKDFQPEESESQKILTTPTPTPGRPFAHQLWLFVPQTCVSVTLGNLSSLTLQQETIMAIQTGGSSLTCMPSLRGHSRSPASHGLITQPTLCERNRSELVSLKFPFAHSGWHYRCSVTLVTQQRMRVLMGARPLLRNARHRTMITPVNPPRLRVIHISPSYQTVYRSFEIILEWELPLVWNSNPTFYANLLLRKNIQSDMN